MALPRTSTVPEGTRRFAGYDGELGDLLVRFVRSPEFPSERQVTPVANADLADQLARTPEEVVATGGPAGLHAFTLDDPQAGEGRRWAHRPTERPTDALRFWSSRGVDVSPLLPGEQEGGYTIRLAKDWTRILEVDLEADEAQFVAAGDNVIVYIDPANRNETRAVNLAGTDAADEELHATKTYEKLGVISGWVWALESGDGVSGSGHQYRDPSDGTWAASTWGWGPSTDIDLAVVSTGNRILWQREPGAAVVPTSTSEAFTAVGGDEPEAFDVTDDVAMTAAADAGLCILVATSDGAVRLIAPDSDGALTVVGRFEVPSGEVAVALGALHGRVLIGTAAVDGSGDTISRLYTGQVVVQPDGSYEVGDIRLRHTFDDSAGVTYGPTGAVSRTDSIYMGVPGGTNRDTSIWRYNVATDAITEEHTFDGVTARTTGFVVLDDVVVVGLEGLGFYRQDTAYVTEGWIISSAADFYDHRSKAWHTVRADGANIDLADTVFTVSMSTDPEAQLDPDHTSWVPVLTVNDPSDLAVDWPIPPALVRAGRYIIIKLDLATDSAGANTPHASATITGSHKTDDITIVLPVNVSDRIERPGRRPIHVRGLGDEYDAALRGLAGEVLDVVVYQPPLRIRGQVVSVGTRSISRAAGSMGLAAEVTVAGKVVAASQPIDLVGSLGLSTLGTVTLGGAS